MKNKYKNKGAGFQYNLENNKKSRNLQVNAVQETKDIDNKIKVLLG